MLSKGQRNKLEGFSTKLSDEDLKDEDQDHNGNEEIVVSDFRENIEFIFLEFSGVEEVEDLKENENVKENAEMLTSLMIPILHMKAD